MISLGTGEILTWYSISYKRKKKLKVEEAV